MTNQPTASIEDLLRHDEYDDEPAPAASRRGSPWAWLIRTVLIAAALTGAAVFGFLLVGVQLQVVPVFSGLLALLVLPRVLARVAAPPPPRRPRRGDPDADDGRYDWHGQDALQVAVRRWEARLDAVHSDPGRFSRTVLPVLTELTDERLRQRHGLTRATDPRRARELLGEPLWRLLSEPGRPPRRGDLAAHLETLERL
ncbi:MAG TPA: hypothetical protein VF755_24680 [Catenuloplanes sp.]|jgi:hypothetical protein